MNATRPVIWVMRRCASCPGNSGSIAVLMKPLMKRIPADAPGRYATGSRLSHGPAVAVRPVVHRPVVPHVLRLACGFLQGPRKTSRGNNWVIAAIVVRLPFTSRPVALPVLAKLVVKGTNLASRLWLARRMTQMIAGTLPGRDAASSSPPDFRHLALTSQHPKKL